MGKVIELLLQNSGVTTLILSQQREYEYDYSQVKLLMELMILYKKLNKDERYVHAQIVVDPEHEQYIRGIYTQFQGIISKKFKEDPLAAYIELKRLEKRESIKWDNILDERHKSSQSLFLQMLREVIALVEELMLIKILMPHTKEYIVGQREIYANVFHPVTRPDFMYTKLLLEFPEGNLAESYSFNTGVDQCQVNIFNFDDDVKILYHLTPPEFKFEEELYELLDDAKRIMSEHKPAKEEFVDPQRMR